MTDRAEVARKLAEKLSGWTIEWRRPGWFRIAGAMKLIPFPPADAPLHVHLAFAGRVSDARGKGGRLRHIHHGAVWRVALSNYGDAPVYGTGPDPSLAVALAVIGEDHE